MSEMEIFWLIPQFRQYLEMQKGPQSGRNIAPTTIQKYICHVTSFYAYFHINESEKEIEKIKIKIKEECV
ncbi:hypothetical protein V7O66_09380 [Methanolobus sp. ZRKC3]|uniref:hypothetical protein n=1 Tax=Methanolobus sp. ZRKC3 TaxID=3125786 RepID=UPI003243C16A